MNRYWTTKKCRSRTRRKGVVGKGKKGVVGRDAEAVASRKTPRERSGRRPLERCPARCAQSRREEVMRKRGAAAVSELEDEG